MWQRSPFLTKFFQKIFILLPVSGQHSTYFYTLLRGHPYNTRRMVNTMKDQTAERILLDLLTFTAAQLKTFAENEAVAGNLDASLLAQLAQSPEDLLQAN